MNVDPFTAASATYRNAMRHPSKSGEAFEVTVRGPSLRDIITLAALIGCGWLVLTVAALAASHMPGA